MSHHPKHLYEFGPFRLDAGERLLLRDGESVPLTPKAFDLLSALVEHHGHLLEKEELLKTVWPDTFVEEANLPYNISHIRKAMGDGENGQRYIETVPKRGYRFVAPVKEQAAEPSEVEDVPPSVASAARARQDAQSSKPPVWRISRWARRRPGFAALLLILLLAGLASAFGYQWQTSRSKPTASNVAIKSIAVLPPRPLQSAERDEALEVGMVNILITRLGSLRQLIVRPESAVERYARPDQDPLAAGHEQKVDVVLDSRYQRSGNKFRFTLRLLRVADGATLWADTLDQQAADLFAIEDAISGKVISALSLTLSSADKELLAKRYTNSAEAWMLYVRGRHLLQQRRIPDIQKAITYFQQAIALDHGFALAHAQLGFSFISLSWLGHSPAKEVMPKAKVAIDQALKLDDQLAEAHTNLAHYKLTYEWDFIGAEQEYKHAIDLNPNSADTRQGYSSYLTFRGRFDQAISEVRKAEELEPTNQFFSRNVGMALFYARRYDEAIEQSLRAIELNPNSGPAYNWIIRAYEMKGDEQGAFAALLKQTQVSGAGPDEIAGMKAAFAAGGLKGCWRRALDRWLEREKRGDVIMHDVVAMQYARLGQKEQALARLQKAVEDRNFFVVAFNVEPIADSYRADPRFVALVQHVGLEP